MKSPIDFPIVERTIFSDNDRILQEGLEKKAKAVEEKHSEWRIDYRQLRSLLRLHGSFNLLAYMVSYVYRRGDYGGLDAYHNDGKLVFAQTHNHIAKELGISRSSVIRYLKILKEHNLIEKIGEATIRTGKIYKTADVYRLGDHMKINTQTQTNYTIEYFLYEDIGVVSI